ncbi:FAD/FMN-containing dehydrogenase [Herbihabitans rhizosphaerae]|uniref:FAD/FMN-containing dehydrogenase n=1 Tax=Herbihabitans rhizosphaerae TaxID=1872711 RepID=A0A4Q7KJW7_9PSEU|nr:FAD-binding oxidoreductase [Herbihabitans rhizosphaerae]RZS36494.1 FAD/FMN-containing dehydrogenase [Herbihabitans rhizosphaerae]
MSQPIISTPIRRTRFTGPIYLPGQDGYDERRKPVLPIHDPKPAMIVEASGAADVRAAVIAAREHDLPFGVQATGHGLVRPSDGGLLVRTSGMATVLVDPDRRVARAGPGARWQDVIAAAEPFGLAPLSGTSPSVGVAGYTLGGGHGWLARQYGFAADSLLRAEIVTADGAIATVSRDKHPNLFWALRGGSGNFGVVTALEFRLYPAAEVYAGVTYYPIEAAADTLAGYREWTATAPDEISTAVLVRRMPESSPEPLRGKKVLAIRGLSTLDPAATERVLAPLRAKAGTPIADTWTVTSYAAGSVGGTPPKVFELLRTLPDQVIDVLTTAVADDVAPTVEVRHWGGAMARPAADAGPVGARDAEFSVTVDARPAGLPEVVAEHATGGAFLNFLADPSRVQSAYTRENYRRLTHVKRVYDPDNFFHLNHNIAPR